MNTIQSLQWEVDHVQLFQLGITTLLIFITNILFCLTGTIVVNSMLFIQSCLFNQICLFMYKYKTIFNVIKIYFGRHLV